MAKDKSFMLLRFQIMSFALSDIGRGKISNAYLQAWDDGVYPIGHQAAHWHEGYEDEFDVTHGMMEDISQMLDQKWTGKQPIPSVYDLEDHYRVRVGGTPWDRWKIIIALRYMYLLDWFDEPFWRAIMSNHPTEAGNIAGPYDRDKDVYFI